MCLKGQSKLWIWRYLRGSDYPGKRPTQWERTHYIWVTHMLKNLRKWHPWRSVWDPVDKISTDLCESSLRTNTRWWAWAAWARSLEDRCKNSVKRKKSLCKSPTWDPVRKLAQVRFFESLRVPYQELREIPWEEIYQISVLSRVVQDLYARTLHEMAETLDKCERSRGAEAFSHVLFVGRRLIAFACFRLQLWGSELQTWDWKLSWRAGCYIQFMIL